MNDKLSSFERSIAPAREQLLKHPLYRSITDVDSVQRFMAFHVFAVWDFMSLLTSLQRSLTCTQVPWVPRRNAETARFINEIVLGEESDETFDGGYLSHYELYLLAMDEVGANTTPIQGFVERVRQTDNFDALLSRLAPEGGVYAFMNSTFSVIRGGAHEVAASFLFGREDIIPDMFAEVLKQHHLYEDEKYRYFRLYLERHIEVDGDHHGPLARKMLISLCGDCEQKWAEAKLAAHAAIEARILLWDHIHKALTASQTASR
tara:strand:- start:99681 stop:100466 length:786 start_codon:yes stop_codon:yes gene_type:complete